MKSREYPKKENRHAKVSGLLPAERAALGQTGLATGGLAQDGGAALADDDGLGVREDGGDGEAAGALDVHEEGAGGGHESLELVLLSLGRRGRVQKVDGENLDRISSAFGRKSSISTAQNDPNPR